MVLFFLKIIKKDEALGSGLRGSEESVLVGLSKELGRIKERLRLFVSESPPDAFTCSASIELEVQHRVRTPLVVLENSKNGSEEGATRNALVEAKLSARVDFAVENDATFAFDENGFSGIPPGGACLWTGKLLDSDDDSGFAGVDLRTGIGVEIDAGVTIMEADRSKTSGRVCAG